MSTKSTTPVSDMRLLDNDVHIHAVQLDELALARGWETALSKADLERAVHFKFDRDRDRYLRRRFLLRSILSNYLGIPAQGIVFEYSPEGKPHLAGNSIYFNVSESAGYCAAAFSQHTPLGVDVEKIRPLDDLPLVAGRHFSRAEQTALARMADEDKVNAFYHIWTQKEAFIKAIGLGLSFPLHAFDVEPNPHQPGNLLAIHGFPELEAKWEVHSLLPSNDFRLAVCYSKGLSNVKVSHLRWNEIGSQ